MGLCSSSYYYEPVDPRKRELWDVDLRDRIEAIHSEFPGYGYRRLRWHLAREGQVVNSKRIRRVMRKYGLFPIVWKSSVHTTQSQHGWPVYPNLIREVEVIGL